MSEDIKSLKIQEDNSSLYPFNVKISIRGVEVKSANIVNVVIKESIFGILPTMEMVFNDYGVFSDVLPFGDEDEVVVQISTDSQLEGVKTTFCINDYHIVPLNTENLSAYMISFTAILKNNIMFYPLFSKGFSNASSSDAIEEIFNDCGFDVSVPIKTKDRMTWLQANMSNFEMINHIVDYSYTGDGSILFAFVDKNNNAYIKDLITETKKLKSFDVRTATDPMKLYYAQLASEDKKIKQLGYNFFRFGFHPGSNNKNSAYGSNSYFYDLDKGRMSSIVVDSDMHPMTDYSMKKKSNIKSNIVYSEQSSTQYKSGNYHGNYKKAYLQNKYIRDTFFSDVLIVNSYFNDEIKLLDKVNVEISSIARSTTNNDENNKIYSGDYLVVGIVNQVNHGGNYKSIMYLSRGGINKPAFVEKTEMQLNDK